MIYNSVSTMGMVFIESPMMTITRPHAMSSERTLAKVSGGRWFPKNETVADPQLLRISNGQIVGHPETIRKLKWHLARL